MSVVRINAITVPAERAEELERRFAARAGQVSGSPGFEAFELLRPSDERGVYRHTRESLRSQDVDVGSGAARSVPGWLESQY